MPKSETCVFCPIIRGEAPATVITETENLLAFLDIRPLFHGHTLLLPKQHVRLLSDLPKELAAEFLTTAQRLERAIEDGLPAAGSMVLVNNVISQSVPHLHLHVIPRNPRDGLRFWLGPRHPYDAAHPAEEYAAKIRTALPPALAPGTCCRNTHCHFSMLLTVCAVARRANLLRFGVHS
jgi:histidine triad (HIT) family protein